MAVAREVEVSDGRTHAWIDLLAFHPATRTVLILEIKTRLDDIGAIGRQIGWYERHAAAAARGLGFIPARQATWLIGLASEEVDQAIVANRSTIEQEFPARARHMLDVARGKALPAASGVALVNPASRRADWLLRTKLDGRRSKTPYVGYADAARRFDVGRR